MTLITRISRLFRADFHALLDSLEQPDVLLRQALREMEEAQDLDGQCEQRWMAQLAAMNARRGELEQNLAAIAGELDICFAAGREPLARSLIKRRLETERLQERLARQSAALEKSLADIRGRMKEQEHRLEALRQQAALFDAEPASAFNGGDCQAGPAPVGEDDIEIALLREKQRRMAS